MTTTEQQTRKCPECGNADDFTQDTDDFDLGHWDFFRCERCYADLREVVTLSDGPDVARFVTR